MKPQIHDLTIVAAVLAAASVLHWLATGTGWWAPIGDSFSETYRAVSLCALHLFALSGPSLVTRK